MPRKKDDALSFAHVIVFNFRGCFTRYHDNFAEWVAVYGDCKEVRDLARKVRIIRKKAVEEEKEAAVSRVISIMLKTGLLDKQKTKAILDAIRGEDNA